MSRLYIANTSRNVQQVSFRVPESARPIITTIAPGRQESVYPEGTAEIHQDIVDQLTRYGLVPVSDIDRTKAFVGLCYQTGKPISSGKMIPVFQHNDGVLNEQAQQTRKIAALALDESLSRNAQEAGIRFNGVDVNIEEQETRGADTQINETISVENQRRGSRARLEART